MINNFRFSWIPGFGYDDLSVIAYNGMANRINEMYYYSWTGGGGGGQL